MMKNPVEKPNSNKDKLYTFHQFIQEMIDTEKIEEEKRQEMVKDAKKQMEILMGEHYDERIDLLFESRLKEFLRTEITLSEDEGLPISTAYEFKFFNEWSIKIMIDINFGHTEYFSTIVIRHRDRCLQFNMDKKAINQFDVKAMRKDRKRYGKFLLKEVGNLYNHCDITWLFELCFNEGV
jgi:hypothetical protein